jgi:hypothetical protein
MIRDPRSGIGMHLAALDAGFAPWLPLIWTRDDVGPDLYDQLVWEGFQADYPEIFAEGAA